MNPQAADEVHQSLINRFGPAVPKQSDLDARHLHRVVFESRRGRAGPVDQGRPILTKRLTNRSAATGFCKSAKANPTASRRRSL
jgi:hypothetical protein